MSVGVAAALAAVLVLNMVRCEPYDYEYSEGENDNNYINYYDDKTTFITSADFGRVRRFGENTPRALNPKYTEDVKGAIKQMLSGHELDPFEADQISPKPYEQYSSFTQLPLYNSVVLEVTGPQAVSLSLEDDSWYPETVTKSIKPGQMISRSTETGATKWILAFNAPKRSSIHSPVRSATHVPARTTTHDLGRSTNYPKERLMTQIPEKTTIRVPEISTMYVLRSSKPYVPEKLVQAPLDSIAYEPGSFFIPDETIILEPHEQPMSEVVMTNETGSTHIPGTINTDDWVWIQEQDLTTSTEAVNNFQVSPYTNDDIVNSLNSDSKGGSSTKAQTKQYRKNMHKKEQVVGDANGKVEKSIIRATRTPEPHVQEKKIKPSSESTENGLVTYEPGVTRTSETFNTDELIWMQEQDMTSSTIGLSGKAVQGFLNDDIALTSLKSDRKVVSLRKQHTIAHKKGGVREGGKIDWRKIPYDNLRQGDDDTLDDASIITDTNTTLGTDIETNTTSGTNVTPETSTTTETTTTETTTTTPTTTTTAAPRYDVEKFLAVLANLTENYAIDIVSQVNESLKQMSYPTCGPTAPTTTVSWDYGMNKTIISKCFVCGLETPGIPYEASCADAFAGDFLPLVPQNPRAKAKIARFRKYCRYGDFNNFWHNATQPRTIYGRWTGGCSVRWTDLSGVYTQRSCRNRKRAVTGLHYGSKRMAKLEMTLSHVDSGCVVSPVATLLPLSRGISLFARFHACVCMGNWCNAAVREMPRGLGLVLAVLVLLTSWKH